MSNRARTRYLPLLLALAWGLLGGAPTPSAQTLLSGSGVPAASTGLEGQFFYDSTHGTYYGPKTTGTWGTASAFAIGGSTAGVAPAAGLVGEEIESNVAVGSAVPLTNSTPTTITSVTLTPGNWLCSANFVTAPAGGTTTSLVTATLNTTTNALATAPNDGSWMSGGIGAGAGIAVGGPVGTRVYRVSSNTTVYLVASVTFSVSTMAGYGHVDCWRQP